MKKLLLFATLSLLIGSNANAAAPQDHAPAASPSDKASPARPGAAVSAAAAGFDTSAAAPASSPISPASPHAREIPISRSTSTLLLRVPAVTCESDPSPTSQAAALPSARVSSSASPTPSAPLNQEQQQVIDILSQLNQAMLIHLSLDFLTTSGDPRESHWDDVMKHLQLATATGAHSYMKAYFGTSQGNAQLTEIRSTIASLEIKIMSFLIALSGKAVELDGKADYMALLNQFIGSWQRSYNTLRTIAFAINKNDYFKIIQDNVTKLAAQRKLVDRRASGERKMKAGTAALATTSTDRASALKLPSIPETTN